MEIEKLYWMRDELRKMVVVTEQMLQETEGHTPEPEVFESQDQTNPVAAEESAISYQELQAVGLTLHKLEGRTAVERLMKALGVQNLKLLPTERYSEAMEIGNKLIQEIKSNA